MAFDAGTIEATLDLDRGPFRRGMLESRREAEAFEKRGIKLKVELDRSAISQIDSALGSATGRSRRGIKIPVGLDQDDLDRILDQIDRIGDNTETTARRSGNRLARVLLNPLVLQLGLLPGIAAASAAAGALALGALPLAMAGVGIAALKSNETIKIAYSDLWDTIRTDAQEIAAPLETTFTNVADAIRGTWKGLQPELTAMFKDAGPLIEEFADGVLGAAEEAIPRFRTAIQLSGPAMRGFSSLTRDLGAGLGEMTVEIAHSSSDVGRSTELLGEMIRGLLQDVGELVALFAGAWADVGPKFNRVFDQMMDAVVGFTEGGLRGFTQGLDITLSILEAVMNVIGPFADVFGQVGGYALSAAASWKLLAGAIGLAGRAWGAISPANWAGKMSGVSQAIANMSNNMGMMAVRMGASEKAGERVTSVTAKMGNAVVKTAGSLPLLGTAFAVVQGVIDHFWPSADKLADKLAQGGAAAAEARDQMYDVGKGYNEGNLWAQTFAATADEVNAALKAQRANMTEVERAQQDAARAQNNYTYAVDRFGKSSPQAEAAAQDLASATDYVEVTQRDAANATQTHTDKIIAQTAIMLAAVGARLGYQGSLLSMEQAQRALADAIEQHGVGSLEARQADIAYQQSILSTVNALGERVKAENATETETEQNRLATAAMHQEIARLAVEAGTNLPPALAEMASKLSDAELRAMGVTREVDGTGRAIYKLPPGKALAFPNDAPIATQKINEITTAINNIPPSKWFNYYINYVVKGAPPAGAPSGAPAGGGGLIGSAPPRAKGGPVQRGMAYWVGEEGIPELFFPKVDGFVFSGADSAKITSGSAATNGRPAGVFGTSDGSEAQLPLAAMVQAFKLALIEVLTGAKLEVQGDQLARVVNLANARNGVR